MLRYNNANVVARGADAEGGGTCQPLVVQTPEESGEDDGEGVVPLGSAWQRTHFIGGGLGIGFLDYPYSRTSIFILYTF
jgi:hypothetical protein